MNNASGNEKAPFGAARELTDTAQRRTFLDYAYANDPAMRRRLGDILDSQTKPERFLADGKIGFGFLAIARPKVGALLSKKAEVVFQARHTQRAGYGLP